MKSLTIELPDDKYERLKALAEQKNLSIKELIEDLANKTLEGLENEKKSEILAASGEIEPGLELLDKLD